MKSIYKEGYARAIEALIGARKKQSLTQKQVAEKLDRPQSYVAKYEICERRIDVYELKQICDAIDCDIHKIIDSMY